MENEDNSDVDVRYEKVSKCGLQMDELTEEVAALQVAVQDVLLVNVLETQDALREPTRDLLLAERLVHLLSLLDLLVEIAAWDIR